jgi:hypothetical protein
MAYILEEEEEEEEEEGGGGYLNISGEERISAF